MSPDELRAEFHLQIRLADRDADTSHVIERDGPVRRSYPADPAERGAMIESPEGLGAEPDCDIARQRDFFLGRGQRVEWKTYAYDEPADLGERLARAGFLAEEVEALILGDAAAVAADPPRPDGVIVRAIEGEQDIERVADLHEQIWPGSRWVTHRFADDQRAHPDLVHGTLVEQRSDGPVLCAGWLRLVPGSGFGGLWGGATHPDWRGRGLYRATVAHRAQVALGLGFPYLRVDASPHSRPILQRSGLHQVSTTTPYVLDPAALAGG